MTVFPRRLADRLWYGDAAVALPLAPLGWIFAGLVRARRLAYLSGILPVREVPVPVIVVGNITVGGTGKTPLVIWLAEFLRRHGHRPGILSRGYRGSSSRRPQQVRPDSPAALVGDEPVLIARRTHCPVAVAADRHAAAVQLLAHHDCNLLICDDGLQHLRLGRDLEIAVIDGDRRFGNGRLLPAGPLRESPDRLREVDLVVAGARAGRGEYLMQYRAQGLYAVTGTGQQEFTSLRGIQVHAVAGIGNPARFFSFLRGQGLRLIQHEFPDHHPYRESELDFGDGLPVVMTEKDAVKCTGFRLENLWYVPIDAQLPAVFEHRLLALLNEIMNGQKTP